MASTFTDEKQLQQALYEQRFYDSWYGKIYEFFRDLLSWLFSLNDSTHYRSDVFRSGVESFLSNSKHEVPNKISKLQAFIKKRQEQCLNIIREVFKNYDVQRSHIVQLNKLLEVIGIESSVFYDIPTTTWVLTTYYQNINSQKPNDTDYHHDLSEIVKQYIGKDNFLTAAKNEVNPKMIKFHIESYLSIWNESSHREHISDLCSNFLLHFFSTQDKIDLSFLNQVQTVVNLSHSVGVYVNRLPNNVSRFRDRFNELLDCQLLDNDVIFQFVELFLPEDLSILEEDYNADTFTLLLKAYDAIQKNNRQSEIEYEVIYQSDTTAEEKPTDKLAYYLLQQAIYFQFIKEGVQDSSIPTTKQQELLQQCHQLEIKYRSIDAFDKYFSTDYQAYQRDALKTALFLHQFYMFQNHESYTISESIKKAYLPIYLNESQEEEGSLTGEKSEFDDEASLTDEKVQIEQQLAHSIESAQDFLDLIKKDTDIQRAISVLQHAEFPEHNEVIALLTFKDILENAKDFNALQQFIDRCPIFCKDRNIISLWDKYSTFLEQLPQETAYQIAFYSKLRFNAKDDLNNENKTEVYKIYLDSLKKDFDDVNILSTYQLTQEQGCPKYLSIQIKTFLFERLLRLNNKESNHLTLIDLIYKSMNEDLVAFNRYDYLKQTKCKDYILKQLGKSMDEKRDVQFKSVLTKVSGAQPKAIKDYGHKFAAELQNSRSQQTVTVDFSKEFVSFFKDHDLFIISSFLSCLALKQNQDKFKALIMNLRDPEYSSIVEKLQDFLQSFGRNRLTPVSVEQFFQFINTKPSEIFTDRPQLKLKDDCFEKSDLDDYIKHILLLIDNIIRFESDVKDELGVDENMPNTSNVTCTRGSGLFKEAKRDDLADIYMEEMETLLNPKYPIGHPS